MPAPSPGGRLVGGPAVAGLLLLALLVAQSPASGAPVPELELDLPEPLRSARTAAIRARFGYGPAHPLGPGPSTVATRRFLWVSDATRALAAPPWSTHEAYAEAFELARGAWASVEPERARILVVFSTFDEGGRSLFYTALANDVRGLGEGEETRVFDATPDSVLEGYVWMGRVATLDAAGPDFATEAFLHEIAHRWAAYVRVDAPGRPREALLGRNGSHWSFFADTGNSPMEGNHWVEAEGGWRTEVERPRRFAFSPLDLYLMGLVGPEAVPPTLLLVGAHGVRPAWFSARAEEPPAHRLGVTVSVEVHEVAHLTIDDVLAAAGPRVPGVAGVLPVVLPIGVVLLDDGRTAPTPERLAAFDARLGGWIDAFELATGGRMRLDAALSSSGAGGPLAPCATLDDCDRLLADRCESPGGLGPSVCTKACLRHDGCGPGLCCVVLDREVALRGGGALDALPGLCGRSDPCEPIPDGATDAGVADASTGLGRPVETLSAAGSGGCTCRAAATEAPGLPGLALVLVALRSAARRRRWPGSRRAGPPPHPRAPRSAG